jgi:hypothetical protein
VHNDAELAARSRFGGIVVHGGVTVLDVRADKPVCTLATTVRTADGTVVVDGTAVVRRDPVVARAVAAGAAPPGVRAGAEARDERGEAGTGG